MSNGDKYESFQTFGAGPWRESFEGEKGAVEAAWEQAKAQILDERGEDYDISRDEFVILETRVRGYNPISDYRVTLARDPRP